MYRYILAEPKCTRKLQARLDRRSSGASGKVVPLISLHSGFFPQRLKRKNIFSEKNEHAKSISKQNKTKQSRGSSGKQMVH